MEPLWKYFPVQDPVLLFAVVLLLLLVVPLLFERIRLPGLIGLILAGVAVGPNALNLLARDATIQLLSTIGLLYVMFLAGLEIDLVRFRRRKQQSIVFGLLSFGIPQGVGTALGFWLGYSATASILLGSVLASHTLLAYPLISRLGLAKHPPVMVAVGGTILTDVLALLVLAVIAEVHGGDPGPGFWVRLVGALGVYVGLVVWAVPRLGRWFFLRIASQREYDFLFVLAVLFIVAFLAQVAGIEPIIGAFLAGLVLNRLVPEQSPLMNRIHFVGNTLFIPFFLLGTGMLVDVRVLVSQPDAWLIAGTLVGTILLTKLAAGWGAGMLFRYSVAERFVIFGLTVPQAAATLAATLVGLRIGLFDENVVNGVVVMMLVTCLIGPAVVQRFGQRMVLTGRAEIVHPDDQPERILVPIANPHNVDVLTELALLLRSRSDHDPLYALAVVSPVQHRTRNQVEATEQMLAHAMEQAAHSDVPTIPLVRISVNVPATIVRTVAETRSALLVMGWNGEETLQRRIFGSVIDKVLLRTDVQTVVAFLTDPLNTVEQIRVVLPPKITFHPGFEAGMQRLKQLAARLSASLALYPITVDAGLEGQLMRIRPRVPTSMDPLPGWEDVGPLLQEAPLHTLLVLLSVRSHSLGWHPALDDMPLRLTRAGNRNFLVWYLPELHTAGRTDMWQVT